MIQRQQAHSPSEAYHSLENCGWRPSLPPDAITVAVAHTG